MLKDLAQLKKDLNEIYNRTLHYDFSIVQKRIKINSTTYVLRIKKYPSIFFAGYEYVGQCNNLYVYRQA